MIKNNYIHENLDIHVILHQQHQTAKWVCFPHACQVATERLAEYLPAGSYIAIAIAIGVLKILHE